MVPSLPRRRMKLPPYQVISMPAILPDTRNGGRLPNRRPPFGGREREQRSDDSRFHESQATGRVGRPKARDGEETDTFGRAERRRLREWAGRAPTGPPPSPRLFRPAGGVFGDGSESLAALDIGADPCAHGGADPHTGFVAGFLRRRAGPGDGGRDRRGGGGGTAAARTRTPGGGAESHPRRGGPARGAAATLRRGGHARRVRRPVALRGADGPAAGRERPARPPARPVRGAGARLLRSGHSADDPCRSRQRNLRAARARHPGPRVHPRASGPALRPGRPGAGRPDSGRPGPGAAGAHRGRRVFADAAVGGGEPVVRRRDEGAPPGARPTAAGGARRHAADPPTPADVPVPRRPGVRDRVAGRRRLGGRGWGVDAAYSRPPDSTEQILPPEKYAVGEGPVAIASPDELGRLGAGWTETLADTLGELTISVWLEPAGGTEDAAAAAAGWGGDRVTMYEGPDGAWLIVWSTAWDTPADAAEFAAAAAASRVRGVRVVGGGPVAATDRIVLVVLRSDADLLDRLSPPPRQANRQAPTTT